MVPGDLPPQFRSSVSADGREVSLADRMLGYVPEWLQRFTALTTLDLSGNELTAVPAWLGDLTGLTTLNLANNHLNGLSQAPGSERAALDTHRLTGFTSDNATPVDIVTPSDSTTFWVSATSGDSVTFRVSATPSDSATPVDIETLWGIVTPGGSPASSDIAASSVVVQFDDNIAQAVRDAVQKYFIFREASGSEPAGLSEVPGSERKGVPFSSLESLFPASDGEQTDLSKEPFFVSEQWPDRPALPGSLGNLTSLTRIDLSSNELDTLPEWLGNLTALTSLNLEDNQLTAIPEWLGNLTALSTLKLGRNELTAIPQWLGNLTDLTALDLDGNLLTAIPEQLENLTALITLDLDRNQLTAIPEWLEHLTSLTELSLSGNKLTTLPRQLAGPLTKGLQLKLSANPLQDPLPELVERGASALAAYLGSLEDAIAQYEAKVLLVGEGNVGKTSLVAALSGKPFKQGRPTTHGIEISPLTFRHPDLDLDLTLRAWDFGGQEVYRVSHQFFFSRRALYVVVWNAREGQEQNEVEGWLRRIRLRAGPDARTMVVATHCSERLPELDYPHLEQVFPDMLVGHFDVDSRTGVGLSHLSEAMGEQAAQLPQMGQLVSPRWVAARDEILALAQGEPQILYEQFTEVCERHGVTGQEIITLAQLMHDLGHIIYFGDDEGLRDIVVLDPEWLTKAISYVLEDKPTKEADGVLDHARLREIWQNRDDGSAYPARYHPYFLRLMEKFDISYRQEDDDLHSLVAQLVPHERPVLPWQPRTPPAAGIRSLGLICRLSEPAPGLIPWLTVRHHHSSTGLYWRRGVFLRHPIAAYASEALLELRHSGELAVEVRAPSPDLYFNVLRDSIENLITRRWPGLPYQLFIPCPGNTVDGSMCPGQFPMDGLLRLREHGRTTYPCIECAQENEISLLLTGFTAPEQPLSADVRHQLDRIESSVTRVEGLAAQTADAVRRVLRNVSTEVTDCPRLFTLVSERPAGIRRLRFQQRHYRLTLWCEHPGYWHPWVPASYEFDPPKDWFVQIGPYAALIFRTLQLVVPVAGSLADVLLTPQQLAQAQSYLQLMGTLVADLPSKPSPDAGGVVLGEAADRLTAAEGQALRALRVWLFECDHLRGFGGLRRAEGPSGDLLWVCQEHYPEYDPGLPTIP